MEPEFIDRNAALLLERIRPFSTVFVLLILPFRSNTFFEQVVVGFQSQFRDRSNIVLDLIVNNDMCGGSLTTYVNAPEFLNRVESDDLLQQIIPVVALIRRSAVITRNDSRLDIPCHWMAL